MSRIRGMIRDAGKGITCPNFSGNDYRIMFFGGIIAVTITCILALLTVTYAGSYDPRDLFSYDNFSYSYTGTPAYTDLDSSHYYIGLSARKGTTTSAYLPGEAELTLRPSGGVMATFYNNTTGPAAMARGSVIRLLPGEDGRISIGVSDEDDFNYNMRLYYDNRKRAPGEENETGKDQLRLIQKAGSQYVLNGTYYPGSSKWFEVKDDPCWDFEITVSRNASKGDGWGPGSRDIRSIAFRGQINVTTRDRAWIKAPVSAITAAQGDMLLTLKHAEGTLDVKHIEHKCNSADTVTIAPVKELNVSLLNGQVQSWGYARTLDFREHDFGHPITVVIQEGDFAILTAMLSSCLTIVVTRMWRTIKKKAGEK